MAAVVRYNATLSVMVSRYMFCGSLINHAVELFHESSFSENFKLNYMVLCYFLYKIRTEA
jgi:hypothetical protein